MRFSQDSRQALPLLLALVCPGCSGTASDDSLPDFNTVKVVPAGGVVTLDGKPLPKAVVIFMPKSGPPPQGETDENGRYKLNYGRDGAPPGEYTVAVSYMVNAEGKPQGLSSSLMPPPGMETARQRLPREYSDPGRSKLRATVPPEGSQSLDFDLKGPLLVPETPASAADTKEEPPKPGSSEPKGPDEHRGR